MKKLSLAMLSLVVVVGNMQAIEWEKDVRPFVTKHGLIQGQNAVSALVVLSTYKVVWPYLSSLLSNLPGQLASAEASAAAGASSLATTAQADLSKLTSALSAGA